ncbi:conjugal transfer protein TrbE (plasmid) [Escherichia coli]
MKVIFTSNRLVDFLIRLSITAIVISPVIIWSWDTVKETTADGMLAAAFVILYSGVLLFILYFCFSARKRLARTVLIFTEKSDQLSRATDRVPGLPASPGYAQ